MTYILRSPSKAMPYFARFERVRDNTFRLDTRIYLIEAGAPSPKDRCIAAVVGKNPGAAKPLHDGKFSRIHLDGDNMLPSVRNRFRAAYRRSQLPVPPGAFVRVWNLFYLCDPDLKEAARKLKNIRESRVCGTESEVPPIVWFAWGWDEFLKGMKSRFTSMSIEHPFYYDQSKKAVVAGVPSPSSRAKHTQGMPKTPIIEHLANLLRMIHGESGSRGD